MIRAGDWELATIDTGRFRLDGGAMFGVVPKTLWERTNPADEKNRIAMAARSLLLKRKDRVILVDAGIGSRWSEKHKTIYAIEHDDRAFEAALMAHGVRREDVTDVVFSHLHFDHLGAATREKNGVVELTFPNASYLVQEKQLSHAHHPTEKDRASFRDELLAPLESTGRLATLNGNGEIFPGARVETSNGHTFGHQTIVVQAEGATFAFTGDAIPTASHVPVPYVMGYDLQPMLCLEEKKDLLGQAVRENWVLVWTHDPFRAASRVVFEGGKYRAGEAIGF